MPVRCQCRCMLAFVLLAAAAAGGWGESDYAVIRSARPGTRVRVVSQRAAIGWNGAEEVIIVTTNVSATGRVTVLQVLPLSGMPSRIAPERRESLWALASMIARRVPPPVADGSGGPVARPNVTFPGQDHWYDPVPLRDRTVIAASSADGFLTEVTTFCARQGGRLSAGARSALRLLASKSLSQGYHHFALEAVDLRPGVSTVGPTSYRFRSGALFFPVSRVAPGATPRELQLLLLTRFEPQPQMLPRGLSIMSYRGGSPIRLRTARDEAPRIPDTLAALFAESDPLVLTAVERRMPTRTQDLVLREQPPLSPRPAAVSQQPPGGTSGGVDRLAAVRGLRAAAVTGLAWSRAGDRLCVVEYRMGDDRERTETAAVLDLARGSRQEVALSGWLSPQGWSPDGTQLSLLDHTGNIQVVDVDHDWARPVTSFRDAFLSGRGGRAPADWSPPAWSPSGQWLAFGAFYDAWVVRPDGRGSRQLTQSGSPEVSHASGAGPGAGDSGRRPVTRAAAASWHVGGGRGGGGGGGSGLMSVPHPYAWSREGNVLAYGQADAGGSKWSVHGYDAETGRAVSVGGDLGLIGIKALSWQPGGGRLAVVGIASIGKQVVYLIPRQGAIRELPTALTSVEVMWTGDGRTLLIRGATSGTQRLTVDAVAAEGGAVRTLPPTHFLADREVTILAPQPGRDDIAFALGANVYLARADGSGWRRVQRAGRAAVREMANPLEQWGRDPVVLAAARRWQRAIPRGRPDESPPDSVVYGIWDAFLGRWKARLLAGERISYRDLPEDVRREVLTGLVYQTFRSTSVGGDPAAITVPGWYWWLDEARLGLRQPEPSSLSLTLEGPNGDSAAVRISGPEPADRGARSALLHFWWPALSGAAAVIVALLGWRQARRQRGTADESHSAH